MPFPKWIIEAWTLPGVGTFERKIASVSYLDGSISTEVGTPGRGTLILPGTFDIDTLLSDTEGALIRVMESVSGSLIERKSFYARRWTKDQGEADKSIYTVTGPGIGDVMASAAVYAFDHPKDPTLQPDWKWGGENEFLGNAELMDNNLSFDFDDDESGGAKSATAMVDTNPVVDGSILISTAEFFSGGKSLEFDPNGISGAPHSGIQWDMEVDGNGRNALFTIRLKSNTLGRRFVAFAAPDPKGSGTNNSVNGFEIDGIYYVELDNVARAAAKDGNPGGSTDGTWQTFSMDVDLPVGQTNFPVGVIYDHHALPDNGPVSYVDDMVVAGNGFGMAPWTSIGTMTTWSKGELAIIAPEFGIRHVPTGVDRAGSDQVFTVTPGLTISAATSIWLVSGGPQDFEIKLTRAEGGALIASNTVTVSNTTLTRIEVTGLVVDTGSDQVRVSILPVNAIAFEWWAARNEIWAGLTEATVGAIVIALMDDAAVDHIAAIGKYNRDHLGFIKYDSFSATVDSNGVAWPEAISFRAQQGKSYAQVLNDLAALGYEWEVVWNDGASMYELKVYVPYDPITLAGGIGADLTAGGVAVTWGAGVTGGPLVRSAPSGTAAITRGADGLLGFATDPTAITNFGRREIAQIDGNLFAADTVQALADQMLVERISQTIGQQTSLSGDVADRPLREFDIGDRIATQSQFGLIDRRVRKIETSFNEEITDFAVDFDRSTFGGASGGAEAIRRLLLKFDGLTEIPETADQPTESTGFAGPIEPTYLVAASNARDEIKAVADRVCSGSDDNLDIQWAIDSLPSGGGRVALTEGTFTLVGTITMAVSSSLAGVGPSTTLLMYGAANGIDQANGSEVLNLTVDFSNVQAGKTGIDSGAALRTRLQNIVFEGMGQSGVGTLTYAIADGSAEVLACKFLDIYNGGC